MPAPCVLSDLPYKCTYGSGPGNPKTCLSHIPKWEDLWGLRSDQGTPTATHLCRPRIPVFSTPLQLCLIHTSPSKAETAGRNCAEERKRNHCASRPHLGLIWGWWLWRHWLQIWHSVIMANKSDYYLEITVCSMYQGLCLILTWTPQSVLYITTA